MHLPFALLIVTSFELAMHRTHRHDDRNHVILHLLSHLPAYSLYWNIFCGNNKICLHIAHFNLSRMALYRLQDDIQVFAQITLHSFLMQIARTIFTWYTESKKNVGRSLHTQTIFVHSIVDRSKNQNKSTVK